MACESDSEFHKHPRKHPRKHARKHARMCERGHWRKQLRDGNTQSLKQTHLGSGTFSRIFWSSGPLSQTEYTNSSPTKRSSWAAREELLSCKRRVCGRGVCERGVCVFVRTCQRNSEKVYKIERESTHAYALSLKEREQPRECTR